MAGTEMQYQPSARAAIYSRVSSKSQAEEDKTSISEQVAEMEAYCEDKGLAIVARYQEVGRGSSTKRPEFQRMLGDARLGRFDTIVCWKSDRLSRGMYPAVALMEIVDAYRINLEAVMDSIDMKTFGLMAAIGKIEMDNFKERASLGRRGAAKQGRVPSSALPYGYRIGDDGRPEVVQNEAEMVRRIFHMYVYEDMSSTAITRVLADEGVPSPRSGRQWHSSSIHRLLGNATYKGNWSYGRNRVALTEQGRRIHEQPKNSWIQIPVPTLVDEDTWEKAQVFKKQRMRRSKRNTRVFYLLQRAVRCSECGLILLAQCRWSSKSTYKGKLYKYNYDPPLRYYACGGMRKNGLRCRKRLFIKAEQIEALLWNEVKSVLQNPDLILAGIKSLDARENGTLDKEIAGMERELLKVKSEEDRAIRLYVLGKITEKQLDKQREFIDGRMERLQAKSSEHRARLMVEADKRDLVESILAWIGEVGEGLDDLTDVQKRDLLRLLLNETLIDGSNKLHISLAIPVEGFGAFASPAS